MFTRAISNLTFDLETIPGTKYPTPDTIKIPGQMKKAETIEAFRNNPHNLEVAYQQQSTSYIEGRIHTIAWKVDAEPVECVFHDGSEEEGILKAFEKAIVDVFKKHFDGNDTIHGLTLIGHHIRGFDLPYLWLRARKYGCTQLLKIIGETPDDIKFEDTMMWACVTDKYQGRASLDKACILFDLPGKGDFDGSMVYGAWKKGENQKIADYGKEDVQKTYDLAVALGIILP